MRVMKLAKNTWKNKALRTVVMELVPLSITLSTSPVFLALCHLTYHIVFVTSHMHIV